MGKVVLAVLCRLLLSAFYFLGSSLTPMRARDALTRPLWPFLNARVKG
jgi:hypothetical protein